MKHMGIAFSTSAPHLTDDQDRPDYSNWDVPTTIVPDIVMMAHRGPVPTQHPRPFRAL
jgi:hypothetical protein